MIFVTSSRIVLQVHVIIGQKIFLKLPKRGRGGFSETGKQAQELLWACFAEIQNSLASLGWTGFLLAPLSPRISRAYFQRLPQSHPLPRCSPDSCVLWIPLKTIMACLYLTPSGMKVEFICEQGPSCIQEIILEISGTGYLFHGFRP